MRITKNRITMMRMSDGHLHLRDNYMLKTVLPYSENVIGHALVIGNAPKIRSADDVTRYAVEIANAQSKKTFKPKIAFYITRETTYEDIKHIKAAGAIAGKLFLENQTGQETSTGSESGIYNLKQAYDQCAAMQELDMPLAIHAEDPTVFCLDREDVMVPQVKDLGENFLRLRISVEHITGKSMMNFLEDLPPSSNIRGTITSHHPVLTLDDVIGGRLHPHFFCKPIFKRPSDRDAILNAMLNSGKNRRVSHGSDSAPWRYTDKECKEGCPGMFTAPSAPSVTIELFEKHNMLHNLENFFSKNINETYGFPSDESDTIEFVRKPWKVPRYIPVKGSEWMGIHSDHIVPFMAGQTLEWSLET